MKDYQAAHLFNRREFAERSKVLNATSHRRNRFFHSEVSRAVRAQVAAGSAVIDIGCAQGDMLAVCAPRIGLGIDIDPYSLTLARELHPEFTFLEAAVENLAETPMPNPDYVVLSMVLDEVYDAQSVLEGIRGWMDRESRLVIVTYNRLWRPLINLAEKLHLKARAEGENYVPWTEIENLLALSEFEVTKRIDAVLVPIRVPLISRWLNRWVAPLPIIRNFCILRVTVARARKIPSPIKSVSIVVAARNESGHIRELIRRVPKMAPEQELIFVEGGSTDDTWQVIQESISQMHQESTSRIVALQQTGKGKGDAVRAGFSVASGELLMILDADLSVPPEELPKFVKAISDDACEFANGSRLVYPMESKAMRFLNILGNKFFGYAFSYLLGQPIRDTLCGTKVLRRDNYERIAANRSRFGDFDPFGDFDLLFGASGLSLRIRDVPVHYKERTYGTTNISRFSHGWLLVRMCRVAAVRLKFVG